MRRSVLMLLVAMIAVGAGPQQKKKTEEPLPPLNAKVEAFAKANLGKPVGDGICITLAVEALKDAGAKRYPFNRSGDYVWGELVSDLKDARPGDILQFRDAVFHGSRSVRGTTVRWHQEYPHHTAVVSKVSADGKVIGIYHQNITIQGRPDSEKENVHEGELRMDSLRKGGWVKAYRPVAAEPPPKPFAEEDDDPKR